MNKTFGEIAYNAYCDKRGWKSVRGEKLPLFSEQSDELKIAWEHASEHVIQELFIRIRLSVG